MKVNATKFEGVYLIENFNAEDDRGFFVKTYNEDCFRENGLCTDFKESFYSVSKKDTIRGMHFQLPPDDHVKLVYVIRGAIEDVLLDLRSESKTYGESIQFDMDSRDRVSLYIPKGIAHGFKSTRDNATVVYNVSSVHNPESDAGIKYDSFGHDWELKSPFLSHRDQSFITFEAFKIINPF